MAAPLTPRQRTILRSRIRAEILRRTTHPATITRELEYETQGADPWNTRSAPGRCPNEATNRAPLVRAR